MWRLSLYPQKINVRQGQPPPPHTHTHTHAHPPKRCNLKACNLTVCQLREKSWLFFENVFFAYFNHIAIRYIVAICKTQMMSPYTSLEMYQYITGYVLFMSVVHVHLVFDVLWKRPIKPERPTWLHDNMKYWDSAQGQPTGSTCPKIQTTSFPLFYYNINNLDRLNLYFTITTQID